MGSVSANFTHAMFSGAGVMPSAAFELTQTVVSGPLESLATTPTYASPVAATFSVNSAGETQYLAGNSLPKIAVLGTGTMSPAAVEFATAHEVTVWAHSEESAQKAAHNFEMSARFMFDQGLTRGASVEDILKRIYVTTSLEDAVRDANFVFETVKEDLPLKQKIFAEVEAFAQANPIIATNTSSLLLSDIVANMRDPSRTVAAHYFNPPHLIDLVEVLGYEPNGAAVNETLAILSGIGKHPIVLKKEVKGYFFNVMQAAIQREFFARVESGKISLDDADRSMQELGARIYLMRGLTPARESWDSQIERNGLSKYHDGLSRKTEPSELIVNAAKEGRLGVKTGGRGLRNWTEPEIKAAAQRRDEFFVKVKKGEYTPIDIELNFGGDFQGAMLVAMQREFSRRVIRGEISPEDADYAMKILGARLYIMGGQTQVIDFGGVDVFQKVQANLYPELSK